MGRGAQHNSMSVRKESNVASNKGDKRGIVVKTDKKEEGSNKVKLLKSYIRGKRGGHKLRWMKEGLVV